MNKHGAQSKAMMSKSTPRWGEHPAPEHQFTRRSDPWCSWCRDRKPLAAGYDIIVFDCDSTLTGIDGTDELAGLKGKKKEISVITKKTMEGKIRLEDVFAKRLEMIKPVKKDFVWLGGQYIKYALPDAKNTIRLLKKQGKKIFIVTGGYRPAIEIFGRWLGIPAENIFAVDLKFDERGNYGGYDKTSPLITQNGKRKIINKLRKAGTILYIGDGSTDLAAKDEADLFVGFGGVVVRPVVKKNADIFIKTRSLLPIVALASGVRI
ncbi:MAG: HAD-IB family phosphatase [bacterium]|nr:HAD-IB family phosphatase [bacterium]